MSRRRSRPPALEVSGREVLEYAPKIYEAAKVACPRAGVFVMSCIFLAARYLQAEGYELEEAQDLVRSMVENVFRKTKAGERWPSEEPS